MRRPGSNISKSDNLQTNWTAVVAILAFVLASTFLILKIGGPMASIGWALFAVLGISVGLFVRANSRSARREASFAHPLDNLPKDPDQAMAVLATSAQILSGKAGLAGAPVLMSELVQELSKLRSKLDSGEITPESAIEQIEGLKADHPHTPAVYWEQARVERKLHGDLTCAPFASKAIQLAVSGGMNGNAATIFVEFFDLRNSVELWPTQRSQLALALEKRGHGDEATWVRQQQACSPSGQSVAAS